MKVCPGVGPHLVKTSPDWRWAVPGSWRSGRAGMPERRIYAVTVMVFVASPMIVTFCAATTVTVRLVLPSGRAGAV